MISIDKIKEHIAKKKLHISLKDLATTMYPEHQFPYMAFRRDIHSDKLSLFRYNIMCSELGIHSIGDELVDGEHIRLLAKESDLITIRETVGADVALVMFRFPNIKGMSYDLFYRVEDQVVTWTSNGHTSPPYVTECVAADDLINEFKLKLKL
jgi:hypothetical protein